MIFPVVNSVFPVFILIAAGYLLKRYGLINKAFTDTGDRLIYYIFFPAMLFFKIGTSSAVNTFDSRYLSAVLASVALVFILSTIFLIIAEVPRFKRGSLSQSAYRLNTYIGMAISLNAFGDNGAGLFSCLIGFVTPFINLFSIFILLWYSESTYTWMDKARKMFYAVITNPFIISCLSGLLYAKFIGGMPVFLKNTFALSSSLTLPMALLSIGSKLTFNGVWNNFPLSAAGAVFKLFVLPLTGFSLMKWLNISGLGFSIAMIYFVMPTSPANYVLSSQLKSDTELASASIMVSTLFSIAPLSLVLLYVT